jgi:DNA polymerase-3 subunit gamma/tau
MLYRKWRPQTFDEVVGQEHVVQTLRNALWGGRVVHAYLFAGPRGTGKTTCARLLAKAVNCLAPKSENEDRRPCNECAVCKAVNEGRLMDLIEIDAASNTGVDDVRELQERIGFQPAQARYKVYVIDEVHMLSNAAFNALLKTLEEPPPHVIFVLATTEPQRLPATIVSRCQRFVFRPISDEAIAAHVAHVAEAEGMEVEPEALALIARHATGALRDALSLLEQVATGGPVTAGRVREVLGLVPEEGACPEPAEGLLDVLEAVAAGDVGQGLGALARLLDEGIDARVVRRQLIGQLRDVLIVASGVKEPALSLSKGMSVSPRLETLAGAGVGKILGWLSTLVEMGSRGTDDRTGLELALVRAVSADRQAVIGPQLSIVQDLAAAPVVDAAPRPSRQVSASSGLRRETSVAENRDQRQDEIGDDTAVTEEEPSPTLPRRLDALQEHWADVLTQVRRMGHGQVQALLRSCKPVAVDERQVILATRYGFHRDRLESSDVRQAVEQALAKMIGEPVALQVVLAEKEPVLSSKGQERQSATGSLAGLPPELTDDPLVRVAVQELGAVARVL